MSYIVTAKVVIVTPRAPERERLSEALVAVSHDYPIMLSIVPFPSAFVSVAFCASHLKQIF